MIISAGAGGGDPAAGEPGAGWAKMGVWQSG
jgi:hypothetical protein